jgi:hypothetical protein
MLSCDAQADTGIQAVIAGMQRQALSVKCLEFVLAQHSLVYAQHVCDLPPPPSKQGSSNSPGS